MTTIPILLAGYGWFRGIPEGEINNAEAIARALDGERIAARTEGGEALCGEVHSLIVPVSWSAAFPCVEEAALRLRPGVILALGTDPASPALRPEPYGVNWCEGRDADALHPDLERERRGPIVPGGEDALRGTLPFEAMTLAMLEAGVPAYLGGLTDAPEGAPCPAACTAGAYLCNLMTYSLADFARRAPFAVRTGFVHVPNQPAYAAARRLKRLTDEPDALARPIYPSMTLEQMTAGIRAALAACLRAAAPDEKGKA